MPFETSSSLISVVIDLSTSLRFGDNSWLVGAAAFFGTWVTVGRGLPATKVLQLLTAWAVKLKEMPVIKNTSAYFNCLNLSFKRKQSEDQGLSQNETLSASLRMAD